MERNVLVTARSRHRTISTTVHTGLDVWDLEYEPLIRT